LFPYTTLFRSREDAAGAGDLPARLHDVEDVDDAHGLARLYEVHLHVYEVRVLQDEGPKLLGMDHQRVIGKRGGAPDLDVTDLNGSHFEAHDGPPGDSILAHAQARVEGAAQRVAEEVGAQHGDHDGQAGERRDPPGAAD